jgi:hypothetical protein
MLKQAMAALLLATPLLMLATPVGSASTEDCPEWHSVCVGDDTPKGNGDPGSTGGSGGAGEHEAPQCSYKGQTVPCSMPGRGFLDGECYWQVMSPPPAADDPLWMASNRTPTDATGAFYRPTFCLDQGAALGHPTWLPIPPTATVSPEELARRALAKARLLPPKLHLTPGPGKEGLVGLPVWLWVETDQSAWGPIQASDSDGPLTVTITAKVAKIEWNMGDGVVVTCTSPGTPYDPIFKDTPSPDCGHAYQRISKAQPEGAYRVTATTTWSVEWVSTTGRNGTIPGVSRSSTVGDIRVGELQVVNGS